MACRPRRFWGRSATGGPFRARPPLMPLPARPGNLNYIRNLTVSYFRYSLSSVTAHRLHLEGRVRNVGLKLTPQRFAVLEYLSKCGSHPTADQISAALNRYFPRASRATVYNTLNALRDAGLISEVRLDGAVARYEANVERHYHFFCNRCRKLEDVPLEALSSLPDVSLGSEYQVDDFEVVIRGLCPNCRRRTATSTRTRTGRKERD
jgi:Fur family transcriptional regulator, peroxide stress response regulator